MNDYYTTVDYSRTSENNANLTSITSYPIVQYNAYAELFKTMGSAFARIAKIFTR